ncbi:MAG: STAS domain-containing protein [Kiritimatiellia bacterium]|jgi:anti-anti-sigma factor|nr:STAS domain-containing protein [Kiritimatiellia bacterium]MDP6810036.1 STAS domain-containing protein [Kiritimatiellia bacterium]MDP7024807.1 STAS domain-containing protein [Kiritimatiellia bacterium]
MAESSVQVCVGDQEAVIKACGRMTFVEAHPLRKFCVRMMKQGVKRYIINAQKCRSMDSTFIGVLAMVSLKGKGGVRVEICAADDQVKGQIMGLGLKRIFLFHDRCEGADDPGEELDERAERAEVRTTMLEAHETLSEADAENKTRFKDVLAYLRENASS